MFLFRKRNINSLESSNFKISLCKKVNNNKESFIVEIVNKNTKYHKTIICSSKIQAAKEYLNECSKITLEYSETEKNIKNIIEGI